MDTPHTPLPPTDRSPVNDMALSALLDALADWVPCALAVGGVVGASTVAVLWAHLGSRGPE